MKSALRCLSILLISSSTMVALAAGRPGFTKFQISRSAAGLSWLSDDFLRGIGGERLHDYPAMTVVRVPTPAADALSLAAQKNGSIVVVRDEWDFAHAPNGARLDTRTTPSPRANELTDGLYLIQFVAPPVPEWLDAIRTLGIQPVQYVAHNSVIASATVTAALRVNGLVFVQWIGLFDRSVRYTRLLPSPATSDDYLVEVADVAAAEATKQMLRATATSAAVVAQSVVYSVSLTGMRAAQIADDRYVIAVEPAPKPSVSGERESIALVGMSGTPYQDGRQPYRTGDYHDWLRSKSAPYGAASPGTLFSTDLWTIALVDTGLDTGNQGVKAQHDYLGNPVNQPSFSHLNGTTALWQEGHPSAIWHDYTTGYSNTSGADDSGHGTMVAGIISAMPTDTATFPEWGDAGGFFYGKGIAPWTNLYIQRVFDFYGWAFGGAGTHATPAEIAQLASDAVYAGASVQNHSWNEYSGSHAAEGIYTEIARAMDEAVLRPVNDGTGRQVALTVAAGNTCEFDNSPNCNGSNALVMPPATAKNVISIGGAESYLPSQTVTSKTISSCNNGGNRNINDFVADGFNNVAFESCRGTSDGRFKPDLLAPVTLISSAKSRMFAANVTFCYSPGPYIYSFERQNWVLDTGTSFAAPQAAAACTLLLRKRATSPTSALSPAMMKAALIGTATSMRGGVDRYTGQAVQARPNAVQGWGRLNLAMIADNNPYETFLDESSWPSFTSSGSWAGRSFSVADPSQTTVFVIAWSDEPGPSGSGRTLVNDFDLRVDSRTYYGGTIHRVYVGNAFSNELSRPFGTGCQTTTNPDGTSVTYCVDSIVPVDSLNNVEMVVIPPGNDYMFDVQILMSRYGATSGRPQRVALFVSNAWESSNSYVHQP
jgi:hypothetical protein